MQIVREFCDAMLLIEGLALSSVRALEYDLFMLARTIERPLLEVDEVGIYDFLAQMAHRGVGSATLRRRIASMRRFFGWAQRAGKRSKDPTTKLQAPRKPIPFPKALSTRHSTALVEARLPKLSEQEQLRNRAMLEIAYGCGLRAQELVSLRMNSVDLNAGVLRVIGKGNKERNVPMSEPSVEAVQLYLERGRPAYLPRRGVPDELFLTRLGRPMTTRNLHDIVKKAARAAGLDARRISAHVLRHSFATDLTRGGADLRVVQLLMGHEDITTTAVYLRTHKEDLQALHRKHHPRG